MIDQVDTVTVDWAEGQVRILMKDGSFGDYQIDPAPESELLEEESTDSDDDG